MIPPSGSWRRERESSFALSQRNARDRWWRSRGVVAKYWSPPRAWRDFPLVPLCSPPTDRPTDRRHPPFKPLATPDCPTCSSLDAVIPHQILSISVFFPFSYLRFLHLHRRHSMSEWRNECTGWMITHVSTLTLSTIFIYWKSNLGLQTSCLCSIVKTLEIFRTLWWMYNICIILIESIFSEDLLKIFFSVTFHIFYIYWYGFFVICIFGVNWNLRIHLGLSYLKKILKLNNAQITIKLIKY